MDRPPKYQLGSLVTPFTEKSGIDAGTDELESDSTRCSSKNGSDCDWSKGARNIVGHPRSASSSTNQNNNSKSNSTVRKTWTAGSSVDTRRTPAALRNPLDNHTTPGTSTSRRTGGGATSVSSNESYVIVSIAEGRGLAAGEVGVASIDLKRPVLIMSQFLDTQSFMKLITRLDVIQPVEIVMTNIACDPNNRSKLCQLVQQKFPNVTVTAVHRKYFNEDNGIEYLKRLCFPKYADIEMQVKTKYYSLAATNALLKYVEFIQNFVYAPSSLRVVYKGSEGTATIDMGTIVNLELLRSFDDPRSENTLWGVLNHTKTPMGSRLLKSNILQPLCDLTSIIQRQDTVSAFCDNEVLFERVRAALSNFLDLDHLLALCIQMPKQDTVMTAESQIITVIHLKHTMERIDALRMALEGPSADDGLDLMEGIESTGNRPALNEMLQGFLETLQDPRYHIILDRIRDKLCDEGKMTKGALAMRRQRCFAVKDGVDGLLDVARRTYSEIVNDMSELIQQTGERHQLPLKSVYTEARGFHMQFQHVVRAGVRGKGDTPVLPDSFLKVNRVKNIYSFTTQELIKLNDRLKESKNEIYMRSGSVVGQLLSEIRTSLGCLYDLSESIGMMDMLSSFAFKCATADYVRPIFSDTMAIQNGRHPILDMMSTSKPVANNAYASADSNFFIITGPNMSGKSTYIRQLVLLQIMAQIGSFVPADIASFRLADHIFSRVGHDDDIEINASTFTVEMKEISYIIQNATDRSLIIMDELGRGTGVDEGIAICHAICEHLLHLKAFTFFVTHFQPITELASLYPNVENYCFEVENMVTDDRSTIRFTHTMRRGRTMEKHYGIQLAEMSSLPRVIIADTKRICGSISSQQETFQELSEEARSRRAEFKLTKRLEQVANNSRLDVVSLRAFMKELRRMYICDCSGGARSNLNTPAPPSVRVTP